MTFARKHRENGVPRPEMRRNPPHGENGQAVVLLLILLAMAGGGLWYAKHARAQKERGAWAFASDVSDRVILRGDRRVLDLTLSPQAKLAYPPSWRERLFDFIRAQGSPLSAVRVSGDVTFQNHFLDPRGHFRGEVDYANGPAYLEMNISRPGVIWQIDQINWIWPRPPEPSPAPAVPPTTPIATPLSPTPEPTKPNRK